MDKQATPSHGPMNWNDVTGFCFTFALMGGAWLEDASGYREWVSETTITAKLGAAWYKRQLEAQGMWKGCWITVQQPSAAPTQSAA